MVIPNVTLLEANRMITPSKNNVWVTHGTQLFAGGMTKNGEVITEFFVFLTPVKKIGIHVFDKKGGNTRVVGGFSNIQEVIRKYPKISGIKGELQTF